MVRAGRREGGLCADLVSRLLLACETFNGVTASSLSVSPPPIRTFVKIGGTVYEKSVARKSSSCPKFGPRNHRQLEVAARERRACVLLWQHASARVHGLLPGKRKFAVALPRWVQHFYPAMDFVCLLALWRSCEPLSV